MKVGFTGTQHTMPAIQHFVLQGVLQRLFPDEPNEFHHGDCIGADEAAHRFVCDLSAVRPQGRIRTVGHPPVISAKRAYTRNDLWWEPEEFLVRNRIIVDVTEFLVAAPGTAVEILRSGTWSTVRYARKLSRPITIIYPNGRAEVENQ